MLSNGPRVIGTDTVAVGKSAIAYSKSFRLIDLDSFALEYAVACTGTPNIKIELEQCTDDTNFYIPNTLAPVIDAVIDTIYHGAQLAPITVEYARFKITEVTGVVDDSVVTLNLVAQKRFTV